MQPAQRTTPAPKGAAALAKQPTRRTKLPQLTRKNSDKFFLYIQAVQCPEHEIDFVTTQFKKARKRPLRFLREDFCGTGISACEFVKRHEENRAVALDLHKPTLAWGQKHNVGKLSKEQQARIRLLPRNVLTPGEDASGVDTVLAMNFSYWLFMTREQMLAYFKVVRQSLRPDGMFFMDTHGGYEATKEMEERRKIYAGHGRWFKYVWEQRSFDPLTNRCDCRIHFEFERGPAWNNAFTYAWRVWSVPELLEMLKEAGFGKSTVYLEGDNGKGAGDGVFRPRTKGDPDASFIAYIVSEQ